MSMKPMVLLLLLAFVASLVVAQTAGDIMHEIPFASSGNTIDLAIENAALTDVNRVTVTILNPPDWMNFQSQEAIIDYLPQGEERLATFSFSVDRKAPVRKDQQLFFLITGPNGQRWTKQMTVSVSPPEHFELFQNYPNPFNPTTTISYQLPADSRVTLTIFNLLGQEIATLVDDMRLAGYHETSWNAASFASGTYIYRIVARDLNGKATVSQKRLVIVK